jgi:hypothetical protein
MDAGRDVGADGRLRLGAHETAIASTFQPSWAILASMGIRPDDSKAAMRALLRRHALLAAYLDALNRIHDPNHRRRAAEFRLEHRPRRDLPTCRVLHFRKELQGRYHRHQSDPQISRETPWNDWSYLCISAGGGAVQRTSGPGAGMGPLSGDTVAALH